jgi:hypothetical protein
MTSKWQQYNIGDLIIEILRSVEDSGHHFGRPYLTAYQLAIEFDRRFHEGVVVYLEKEIGGVGTGVHTSLAQYLALELSRQIRDNPSYPVEGAFISNMFESGLSYVTPNGRHVTSSLTGSQYNLSMFRLLE